jgi:hypothetical protein
MRFLRQFPALLFAFLLAASLGFAGVLVEQTTKSLPGEARSDTSIIRLESNRARIEGSSGGRDHVMIYRADRETMYMIDPAAKTYREMTKQDLEKMMGQANQQMSQMQKMMEEQMKNMPPERRQMVEQMMKQKMGQLPGIGAAAAETSRATYRKVASGETVGQWTCDKYEGTRDGQKQSEVWTTNWAGLGVSMDDFRIFQDLAQFFERLNPSMSDQMFRIGPEAESEQGYAGVPVRRIYYRNGAAYQQVDVTQVTRQSSFEDTLFEPPAGYKKETMPQMPGGR